MEYIVMTNKVFLIGTASEIKEFLKEKSKTCRTINDFIFSESQLSKRTKNVPFNLNTS
jgi:hypothetical protein